MFLTCILYKVFICSNGSGRTGTFITIYTEKVHNATDGMVDISYTVKSCQLQKSNNEDNCVSDISCNNVTIHIIM